MDKIGSFLVIAFQSLLLRGGAGMHPWFLDTKVSLAPILVSPWISAMLRDITVLLPSHFYCFCLSRACPTLSDRHGGRYGGEHGGRYGGQYGGGHGCRHGGQYGNGLDDVRGDEGRQGHCRGGELKVRADCAGVGAKRVCLGGDGCLWRAGGQAGA